MHVKHARNYTCISCLCTYTFSTIYWYLLFCASSYLYLVIARALDWYTFWVTSSFRDNRLYALCVRQNCHCICRQPPRPKIFYRAHTCTREVTSVSLLWHVVFIFRSQKSLFSSSFCCLSEQFFFKTTAEACPLRVANAYLHTAQNENSSWGFQAQGKPHVFRNRTTCKNMQSNKSTTRGCTCAICNDHLNVRKQYLVIFYLRRTLTVLPRKSEHPVSPNTQVRITVVSSYQGWPNLKGSSNNQQHQ